MANYLMYLTPFLVLFLWVRSIHNGSLIGIVFLFPQSSVIVFVIAISFIHHPLDGTVRHYSLTIFMIPIVLNSDLTCCADSYRC